MIINNTWCKHIIHVFDKSFRKSIPFTIFFFCWWYMVICWEKKEEKKSIFFSQCVQKRNNSGFYFKLKHVLVLIFFSTNIVFFLDHLEKTQGWSLVKIKVKARLKRSIVTKPSVYFIIPNHSHYKCLVYL